MNPEPEAGSLSPEPSSFQQLAILDKMGFRAGGRLGFRVEGLGFRVEGLRGPEYLAIVFL